MTNIVFGTDGWRDILGQGFNDANVKRVTLAIGKYVYETCGYDKNILIGYDPRNMAKEYAAMSASILAECGFNVKLSDKIVPTPVLAYNSKFLNSVSIMFTASHNPPEYLGMKFIPDYAGPATSDITDKIIKNIDKDFSKSNGGECVFYDFRESYIKHLENIIDFKKIKNIQTNIIYDGLYSASIGYFDYILDKINLKYTKIHDFYDSNFGGGMPDPKPKFLKELMELVKNSPNSIGLANDGDADRFGIINENGEYVSPNIIIAILLKYLSRKGVKGSLVKTVGSSILLDIVARKMNVDVIETPVGFKYVGDAMRKNQVIIGGEESGGLSIAGHIPEKDGILANLLVLEAMAASNRTLVEMENEVYKLCGTKFYNDRVDLKVENSTIVKETLKKFKNLNKIGNSIITEMDLKDGIKLMLGDYTKILLRPSGTEPLLRIYFESDSNEKIEILKQEVNKIIEE